MIFIFRIAYRLYASLISISAWFNPKAKEWKAGRRRIYEDVKNIQGESILWFHAASLGEYEMGRPTMKALKEKYPNKKILVTFFSPSGYIHRKDDPAHDFACYLPHDTNSATKRFLNTVNPELAIFIKYDFWPTLLKNCLDQNIPTAVISSTFRENHFIFSPFGKSIRNLLQRFNLIAVQEGKSAELLNKRGFQNVVVTGDGRFDNVIRLASEEFHNATIEKFCQHSPTFIGGSVWEEDEDQILPQILRHPYLNFILAPHEVSSRNVDRLMHRLPAPGIRLSEVKEVADLENYKVLVIDSIGLLSKLYRFGQFAFVGGGYKTGLHNILEPAVYGLPVFFGPKHDKFWEAEALIRNGGAFEIDSPERLNQHLQKLTDSEAKRSEVGLIASTFIKDNAGASEKTAALLSQLLP